MATTRKAKAAPAAAVTPDQAISVDSLAAFMAVEHPDREAMSKALDLAKEAAERLGGIPVPDVASNNLRQSIHLLASKLLISQQLDAPVPANEVPLVVRYYWKLANAGG